MIYPFETYSVFFLSTWLVQMQLNLKGPREIAFENISKLCYWKDLFYGGNLTEGSSSFNQTSVSIMIA